ncbi:hypothetical protein QYF36_009723 [Acer negundo]|nr:hypothetical protein QYF36_009723 [Acer negundo]
MSKLAGKYDLVYNCQSEVDKESKSLKETIVVAHDAMVEAKRKAEDAKANFDRMTKDLSQQKVSMEVMSREARAKLEL